MGRTSHGPIVVGLAGCLVLAMSAAAAPSADTLYPVADGTIVDGGIYGPFDGTPDAWDWSFNESGYEGSITRSTVRPESSLEHRVVWEYDLRGRNLRPPVAASLSFTIRGAPVFPLPDTPVHVYAYPADLVESPGDYSVGPAVYQGRVTVVPFQPPTDYSLNVARAVEEAVRSGRNMVAFRFQVDPNTPQTRHQAFIDALDSEPDTKPALRVETAMPCDDDRDGDVDLADFAGFFECLSGPDAETVPRECHIFDTDGDQDVDLMDYAALQGLFTGP